VLETAEQYEYTRTYIMNYIIELINKKGIRRKDDLRVIYDDLTTVGYVKDTYKLQMLLRFVNQDFNHKGTQCAVFLKDMRRWKLEHSISNTLDNFCI